MSPDEQTLSWLDKFELFLDRCVSYGEALIVVFLVVAIISTIFAEALWILWADAECRQERFAQVLKTLNENWKVGLVILIPLFFRAIRAFLERLEEIGGMKAPHKMKTSDPKKKEGKEEEE